MKKGFTLLELILATIIGTIVVGLVMLTFLQATRLHDELTRAQSANNQLIELGTRLRNNVPDGGSLATTLNTTQLTYGTRHFVSVSAQIGDQQLNTIIRKN